MEHRHGRVQLPVGNLQNLQHQTRAVASGCTSSWNAIKNIAEQWEYNGSDDDYGYAPVELYDFNSNCGWFWLHDPLDVIP